MFEYKINPDMTMEPEVDPKLLKLIDLKIPRGSRDNCVDLLLPLRKCRHEKWFLPWECVDERHTYEKCLYDE